MSTTKKATRAQAIADMARELGMDADALATELEAARRDEYGTRERFNEIGYSVPLTEAAPEPQWVFVPVESLAHQRATELTKAIGLTADCWVVANGSHVTVYRNQRHAGSAELEARLTRARESVVKAEAAMTEAEASKLEAPISAAKSRLTRATNREAEAAKALSAAREAAFSDEWEAFTETVTVATAEASKLNVERMAEHVRTKTATRVDVMPIGYRDELRPSEDFQPSDYVGEGVAARVHYDGSEYLNRHVHARGGSPREAARAQYVYWWQRTLAEAAVDAAVERMAAEAEAAEAARRAAKAEAERERRARIKAERETVAVDRMVNSVGRRRRR